MDLIRSVFDSIRRILGISNAISEPPKNPFYSNIYIWKDNCRCTWRENELPKTYKIHVDKLEIYIEKLVFLGILEEIPIEG